MNINHMTGRGIDRAERDRRAAAATFRQIAAAHEQHGQYAAADELWTRADQLDPPSRFIRDHDTEF